MLFEKLKYIILILKNIKSYDYWNKKRKGIKFSEYDRGPGYYINGDLYSIFNGGKSPKGEIWKIKMQSGKTGIYECISWETYKDPSDMIKHSWWNFIGYDGFKQITECTFNEFLEIYENK